MKNSYKLLGVFWDGRPILTELFPVYSVEDLPLNYRYKRDLLDYDEYVRSIEISDVLQLEDSEQINELLMRLKCCERIVVLLDKKLKVNNPVIQKYLTKRISQSLRYMKEQLGRIPIETMVQN